MAVKPKTKKQLETERLRLFKIYEEKLKESLGPELKKKHDKQLSNFIEINEDGHLVVSFGTEFLDWSGSAHPEPEITLAPSLKKSEMDVPYLRSELRKVFEDFDIIRSLRYGFESQKRAHIIEDGIRVEKEDPENLKEWESVVLDSFRLLILMSMESTGSLFLIREYSLPQLFAPDYLALKEDTSRYREAFQISLYQLFKGGNDIFLFPETEKNEDGSFNKYYNYNKDFVNLMMDYSYAGVTKRNGLPLEVTTPITLNMISGYSMGYSRTVTSIEAELFNTSRRFRENLPSMPTKFRDFVIGRNEIGVELSYLIELFVNYANRHIGRSPYVINKRFLTLWNIIETEIDSSETDEDKKLDILDYKIRDDFMASVLAYTHDPHILYKNIKQEYGK